MIDILTMLLKANKKLFYIICDNSSHKQEVVVVFNLQQYLKSQ